MEGGQDNGTEGSPGEPLPAADPPPQPLAEGLPEEQPRAGPPHGEDEERGEEEEAERSKGVLDAGTAAQGLRAFGLSALGTEFVYGHLALPGRELSDISILCGYTHLQKMDISCNKIQDLSCVSHMPFLQELNASHNQLSAFFDFTPPKNLREVDFSHNQIQKMKDLSAYPSLTKLLLDYNAIEEVTGLQGCHSLRHLGLAHNRLAGTAGLRGLPLCHLDMSYNQIEKVDGLKGLTYLQRVNLSYNKINCLQGLEDHELLQVINLEDNQVAELSELKWIEDLPVLRDLNLLKNPIQEQDGYWLSAIFMLLQVTDLDLKTISVKEKVAAVNLMDPPPEVVAAEDHRTQILYDAQQPQGVLSSTLPGGEPYPMLVLLGPVAGGRRQLSHKICRKFKNLLRFGPCHTTRKAYYGEQNRFDYYFISQEEFDKMVEAGKFLATYQYSGHSYGLARATVENIAREGLATCVHLEIEGVRSLKKTHFKPRYILLVPGDKCKYGEHLRRTGLFSRPEVEEAVARVDMYLQIPQECPGYLDAVISTDELEEAFTELTHLVKVYLGLEPPDLLGNPQGSRSRAGSGSQLFPEEKPAPRSRAPSRGDVPEHSRSYPRDLLEMMTAPPGSVEEASLQRRFSAVRQGLRSHRGSEPGPEQSPQQLQPPGAGPAASSGARSAPREPQGREAGHASRPSFVPADAALTEGDQILWSKLPIPQRHFPAAGKGVCTSKEAAGPGGSLLRKCSKASSGSSPGPGSHSKPVLPPIPPGWKSSNP